MASWFTRALDRITPWNRGGEVQRRKKREDEQRQRQYRNNNRNNRSSGGSTLSVDIARPNQNITVPQAPKPQRPENLFADLNQSLKIGQPKNVLDVVRDQNIEPVPKPQPGQVVQPTLKVAPTPRQQLRMPSGQTVDDLPDTPERIIDRGLDRGKSWEQIARENNYNVEGIKEYSQKTRPNYGIKVEKPKQSFGDRIRDVFDANTEADKFRRFEGNQKKGERKDITLRNPGNIISRTPVVGHVIKAANTFGTQMPQVGLTVQQKFATDELGESQRAYAEARKTGDPKRINEAETRYLLANKRVRDINRDLDNVEEHFQKNKGGVFNAGTLYDEEASKRGDIKTGIKDIALPTAVTGLDIYTLGKGAAIEQAIRQGGLKTGVRVAAPNIGKAAVGNYASGDLSARSQGASNEQAIKSGLINSILGLVPDIGLPAIGRGLKNRVIPKIMRGKGVNPADVVGELDDAAVSAAAEAANQTLRPRPIRVAQNIPVKVAEDITQVPVRQPYRGRPLIKELEGDFNFPTYEQLEQIRTTNAADAATAFNSGARPDPALQDITPRTPETPFRLEEGTTARTQDEAIDAYAGFLRQVGEGNGVAITPDGRRVSNNVRFGDTGGERLNQQQWRDEAERQLRSGKADPAIQKQFDEAADPEVQSMLARGEQPEVPVGRPIEIKQATGIPVRDETVVPTGLPETPGAVRTTTQTAPMEAKTEAAANAPVVSRPAALPAETQAILDNPKQYNKRQVAAARNQRKLARQLAKTQEETVEAMERIETASPAAASGEGFTPTGEFGKSVNKGAYQKVSRAAEMQTAVQETANMSPGDVLQTARKNQSETGGFNRRDIRNIAALFETKRIPRGTPEWNEARQILKEDGTIWGQTGALRNYTMRRTASANELISRYESKIYRLADDPTKIESKMLDEVEAAEEVYVAARDDALLAYNRFTENPTSANAKAYHAAQDAAEKADKTAKITEYKVADKVLKGNKDIKQARELEKMAQNADLYQMDAVDASMLSGTGTFVRNFVNAVVGGAEETVFGGIASRASRLLTRQNVGGGVGRGSVKGFGEGVGNIVDASAARASNAGKNPLAHIKNWATTGNQLGDSVIDSQTRHNVIDHYTQLLKDEGYSGRELRDRASVMARQDPDDMARTYSNTARIASGLGAGVTRNNKIETFVKNQISDLISGGNPNRFTEATAKLVTRMTIGFPTAIGRSTVEGVKRFTLGAPTFIKAAMTKDPQARAILVKEGIKQAGTGAAVIPPMFYALGAAGMITGSYPKDKEERARWEREGITENSIRLGDGYYQLPAYLGSWAVPGLFYASLGRNGGNWGEATADVAKSIPALLPTDQASNILDVVNGRTDLGKFMAQTGASSVRAATPGGALLNQIAKSFDDTKNDTTSGTNIENFFDKVMSGIPGVNNIAGIPNKEDDAGNVIKNPNPGQLLFGAASAAQGKGEERSAQITADVNNDLQNMTDIGVLDDPNLKAVLDDKEKAIYDKLKAGKQLGEGDLKKLQDAFVKGVSQTGDDTAYLEREQYDSNLAALKLKKQLMEADKTVKPSDIKKVDTAIKRGEIYKDQEIPYDMIESYQTTTLEEWRKMGDPEDDSYDPDAYQKLWALDEQMAKSGVSYKKGDLDKQKYYAKPPGKGRKGRKGGAGSRGGSANFNSDFGQLKDGAFAPQVRAYETIDEKSGSVPIIRKVRPNIVHKIGSSG